MQDFKQHKELLELKYKLKTDLEHLIHKNIMEEIKSGADRNKAQRETRRGK